MITKWLQKNNNNKCIVFMNGWGCDEHPFEQLHSNDYDVISCYDYRTILLPKEIDRLFELYEEVHLVAWSLGVFTANLLFKNKKDLFKSTLAINGTVEAIDNLKGIPPAIFQGTIDGLNERNLEKFQMRMCGGRASYADFKEHAPKRELEDQREELISLQKLVQNHFTDWNIFTSSMIGGKDMIFPFENLKLAWKELENVIVKDDYAHFCFNNWKSWDELMREVTIGTSAS